MKHGTASNEILTNSNDLNVDIFISQILFINISD